MDRVENKSMMMTPPFHWSKKHFCILTKCDNTLNNNPPSFSSFLFVFPLQKGDPDVAHFLHALFLPSSSSTRLHKIKQGVYTMTSSGLPPNSFARLMYIAEKKLSEQKQPKTADLIYSTVTVLPHSAFFSGLRLDVFGNCMYFFFCSEFQSSKNQQL